jgi:hypothetical protein
MSAAGQEAAPSRIPSTMSSQPPSEAIRAANGRGYPPNSAAAADSPALCGTENSRDERDPVGIVSKVGVTDAAEAPSNSRRASASLRSDCAPPNSETVRVACFGVWTLEDARVAGGVVDAPTVARPAGIATTRPDDRTDVDAARRAARW